MLPSCRSAGPAKFKRCFAVPPLPLAGLHHLGPHQLALLTNWGARKKERGQQREHYLSVYIGILPHWSRLHSGFCLVTCPCRSEAKKREKGIRGLKLSQRKNLFICLNLHIMKGRLQKIPLSEKKIIEVFHTSLHFHWGVTAGYIKKIVYKSFNNFNDCCSSFAKKMCRHSFM